MKLIDLHVHSTYSDGTLTPYELAKLAKDTGLTAFALTDHDTVDGIPDALSACQEFEIELIQELNFLRNIREKISISSVWNWTGKAPAFCRRFISSRIPGISATER